jgi:long-chain acyl-CoA synthetase
MTRPSACSWERSYPEGLRWDLPIEPMVLPTMLARAIERHRSGSALDYRGHLISYPELGEAVDRFAAALMARAGVGRGTPLALYLPNSPYHPIGFFGSMPNASLSISSTTAAPASSSPRTCRRCCRWR